MSHVLNHPELVRPETRARVEAAIARLGFVPNASARHLVSGRSDTMAFLVPDAANPFYTDVARALRESANALGLSLILCDAGYDPALEDRYLDQIARMRIRGVFLASRRQANPRLRRLREQGVHVVFVDQVRDGSHDWCAVTVDDVAGGRMAVEHLLARGCRRVAYAGGPLDIPQVTDRIAGSQQAMGRSVAQGRPGAAERPLAVYLTPGMTVADGYEAATRILAEPPDQRPTGVFCGNDLVALGLLNELLRHGIRVPEDVAIVGFDDIEFGRTAVVPLSSVAMPVATLGEDAVRMLVDESQRADHRHRQVLHPPALVVRESSALDR